MRSRITLLGTIALILTAVILTGCRERPTEAKQKKVRIIVTSDSILSTITATLMPSQSYSVTSILPPEQCPGHYDVKLSDIERINKADLVIFMKGMPFMDKRAGRGERRQLILDTQGRNMMTPDAYIYGLGLLAVRLGEYFPEDRDAIMERKANAVREVKGYADSLIRSINKAGLKGKPIIAAAMQREPLEWMGFRVITDYGRPESISVRQVSDIVKKGKKEQAILVADNLQSGPDAGRSIAESLGVPHVVLTNFPSEEGYLRTLGRNVEAVLVAAKTGRNDPARGAGQ